jgi:hypothetical protein
MAINIQQLVEINIRPILQIDGELVKDLPFVIDSQIALQGFDPITLTDKEAVYIAALTLEAIVPRIALIYSDEVQEHRTGPETIRLPSRSDFFKALQKAIETLKTTAGKGAGIIPSGSEEQLLNPWPGCGIRGIGPKINTEKDLLSICVNNTSTL